ncbi:hypothetical protein [Novosphingobium sp. NDB2Meth1]|uniref:hypothetical protein n=1 Tax=Novosphingobium sp. NDB2Meth1 TaxID=1892847 RepID=UPI000931E04E|nr:hypothetical protein [Novosphingobium sp. NDB2Meth1]
MTSKPNLLAIIAGFASEYEGLRVRAVMPYPNGVGGWTYRRLGFVFGKEPVDIDPAELGSDPVKLADALLLLAADKREGAATCHLAVSLVLPDGTEIALGYEEQALLRSYVAARGVIEG